MWLNESVSHNTATPKHADRIVENASANSTPSGSPSRTAANASRQIRNPRCRARHAFVWRDGVMTSLDTPESVMSDAYAISNNGRIVGSCDRDVGDAQTAFFFADGQLQILEYPGSDGSDAYAINEFDQIVGVASLPVELPVPHYQSYAVLWRPGSDPKTLGLDEEHLEESEAFGINKHGQIVGIMDGIPFLYHDGDFELISFPGRKKGRSVCINDHDQFAGYAYSPSGYDQAVFWDSGEKRALGTFGGKDSRASGINNHGHVVGEAGMPGSDPNESWNYHAFLWMGSELIDLNEQIHNPDGWIVRNATDINDHGQICGVATREDDDAIERAFLLTPR